jgi:hypothetical protein
MYMSLATKGGGALPRAFWAMVFLGACCVRATILVKFVLPCEVTMAKVLFATLWGGVPYLVLFWASSTIRARSVVAVAALGILGTDVHATVESLGAIDSSTGSVGLMIQPLFALFIIVPLALVVGLLCRFIHSRRDDASGP